MKKSILFGLLAFCFAVISPQFVTADNSAPDHIEAFYDVQAITGTDILTVHAVNESHAYAYNEPAETVSIEANPQVTPESVIKDISEGFSIPVDTVESLDEIETKGTYYIQNIPDKGSSVSTWISYGIGVLGFLFGVVVYIRQKYLS